MFTTQMYINTVKNLLRSKFRNGFKNSFGRNLKREKNRFFPVRLSVFVKVYASLLFIYYYYFFLALAKVLIELEDRISAIIPFRRITLRQHIDFEGLLMIDAVKSLGGP
jgi:hypothetical protein